MSHCKWLTFVVGLSGHCLMRDELAKVEQVKDEDCPYPRSSYILCPEHFFIKGQINVAHR